MTGCGKTEILNELKGLGHQVLDLEGLAHHKGSAFGALGQATQPSQVNFENNMALALVQLDPTVPIWIEDECRHLGRCQIPESIWKQMRNTHVYLITRPVDNRIDRLLTEYGFFEPAMLINSIQRIRKRFGPNRSKEATHFIQTNRLTDAIKYS